jgi:hypothetical protein
MVDFEVAHTKDLKRPKCISLKGPKKEENSPLKTPKK